MIANTPYAQNWVTAPRSMMSWISRMPCVTGNAYANAADRLGELGDGQDKPAEEDRGEKHQQRELDGLPLGIGDHGDREAETEGRHQHERDRPGQCPDVAEHRHREPDLEQRNGDAAAIPPPTNR